MKRSRNDESSLRPDEIPSNSLEEPTRKKFKASGSSSSELSIKILFQLLNADNDQDCLRGCEAFLNEIEMFQAQNKPCLLVKEYLTSSPKLHEIFSLWDRQRENFRSRANTLIMELLAEIVNSNRFASLQHINIMIAKKILKEKMKQIYSCIGSESSRPVISALRLLSSLISASLVIAKEIFQQFNWNWKSLTNLVEKRNTKGPTTIENYENNIRTHYIRFASSFCRVGDGPLLGEVLAIQTFISPIFKDLIQDPFPLIQEFLGSFLSNVIHRKDLSKKVKSGFFNGYALEQIAKLYSHKDAREYVHKFLLELCCDNDGLCSIQENKSTGEYSSKIRYRNKVMLRLLTSLHPSEDLLQQQLVIKIITLCPELLSSYLSSSSYSLEPRLSLRWIENVCFVCKLLELPISFSSAESRNVEQQQIVQAIFPSFIGRANLSVGLQHSNLMVEYYSLQLLFTILQRLERYIQTLNNSTSPPITVEKLIESSKKQIPDIQTLIALRQSYLSKEEYHLYFKLLQVFKAYQRVFPETFIQTSFDMSKFVSDKFSQLPPDIQYQTASLLLNATHVHGKLLNYLNDLLHVSLTTNFPIVFSTISSLLSMVLKETGLFEKNEFEIDIWLKRIKVSNIPFFLHTISKISNEPQKFVDKLFWILQQKSIEYYPSTLMQSNSQLSIDDALPFSIVLLAAFDCFETFQTCENESFLASVSLDILHYLFSPLPLLTLLNHYLEKMTSTSNILSNFYMYLAKHLSYPVTLQPSPTFVNSNSSIHLFLDSPCEFLNCGLLCVDSSLIKKNFNKLVEHCYKHHNYQTLILYFEIHPEMNLFDLQIENNQAFQEYLKSLPFFSLLMNFLSTNVIPDQLKELLFHSIQQCETKESLRSIIFHIGAQLHQLHSSENDSTNSGLEKLSILFQLIGESLSKISSQSIQLLQEHHKFVFLHPLVCSLFNGERINSNNIHYFCFKEIGILLKNFVYRWVSESRDFCQLLLQPYKQTIKNHMEEALGNPTEESESSSLFLTFYPLYSDSMLHNIIAKLIEIIPLTNPQISPQFNFLIQLLHSILNSLSSYSSSVLLRILNLPSMEVQDSSSFANERDSFPINPSILYKLLQLVKQVKAPSELDQILLQILIQSLSDHKVLLSTNYSLRSTDSFLWGYLNDDMIDLYLNELNPIRGEILTLLILDDLNFFYFASEISDWFENFHIAFKAGKCPIEKTIDFDEIYLFKHTQFLYLLPTFHCFIQKMLLALQNSTDTFMYLLSQVSRALKQLQLMLLQVLIISENDITTKWDIFTQAYVQRFALPIFLNSLELIPFSKTREECLLHHLLHLKCSICECKLPKSWNSNQLELIPILIAKQSDSIYVDSFFFLTLKRIRNVLLIENSTEPHLESLIQNFLPFIKELNFFDFSNHSYVHDLNAFFKLSFQKGLLFPKLIEFVVTILDMIREENWPLFKLKKLHKEIISNLNFQKVLTSENEHTEAKYQLVRVLFRIYKFKPKYCDSTIFSLLLIGYNASMSLTDRLLFKIFLLCEQKNNLSIPIFAYLWSQPRKTLETILLKETSETIRQATQSKLWEGDLIDKKRINTSIEHFPISCSLFNGMKEDTEKDYHLSFSPYYDPSFLLTLCNHIVNYFAPLDCKRFIELGLLSYAIMGFSSEREDIRYMAYNTVAKFEYLLNRSDFKQKPQYSWILKVLKNGITQLYQRIPTVITYFLVKVISILFNPEHYMFISINQFFLQRPILDLDDIPMFYSLFNSSSDEYKKERLWILNIMYLGIQTEEDVKLFKRRHVFELLLSFFNSYLADEESRRVVLKILNKCATILSAAKILVQRGILSWISNLYLAGLPSSLWYEIVNIWKTLFVTLREVDLHHFLEECYLTCSFVLQNLGHVTLEKKDLEFFLIPVLEITLDLFKVPRLQPTVGFQASEIEIFLKQLHRLMTSNKENPQQVYQLIRVLQAIVILNPLSLRDSSSSFGRKEVIIWLMTTLRKVLISPFNVLKEERTKKQIESEHFVKCLQWTLNALTKEADDSLLLSLAENQEFIDSLLLMYPVYHFFDQSPIILFLINSILLVLLIALRKSKKLISATEFKGLDEFTWKVFIKNVFPSLLQYIPHPNLTINEESLENAGILWTNRILSYVTRDYWARIPPLRTICGLSRLATNPVTEDLGQKELLVLEKGGVKCLNFEEEEIILLPRDLIRFHNVRLENSILIVNYEKGG